MVIVVLFVDVLFFCVDSMVGWSIVELILWYCLILLIDMGVMILICRDVDGYFYVVDVCGCIDFVSFDGLSLID